MRRKKTLKRTKSLGRPKNRRMMAGVVSLIVILGMAAGAGSWRSSLRLRNSSLSSPPSAPVPPPSSPSKEYIYAGGRLIATEEPNPVILAAPGGLVANTISNVRIDISWVATPNAHHYQIQRAPNLGGTFGTINSNVIGTTYADTTVTAVNAYLYRVMASDANGNLSPASNVDVATAITFDDNPLATGGVVRAQHVLQLRQAVNAVRLTANLSPTVWFQPTLTPGTTGIKAIDIEEMRTALDQALSALGLPTGGYTNASLLSLPVQKIHIEELRNRVK